jgi:hypothetical protein
VASAASLARARIPSQSDPTGSSSEPIHVAIHDLGQAVGRNTTKDWVMTTNGVDPAGHRPPSWKTFLIAHRGTIAAIDQPAASE